MQAAKTRLVATHIIGDQGNRWLYPESRDFVRCVVTAVFTPLFRCRNVEPLPLTEERAEC